MFIGIEIVASLQLRKESGWYGDQNKACKRLNRTIAKDTLMQKAGHTKETIDINGPGIYIMIHKPTNQAYVGQAKNIGNRLLQHICDATSSRNLVGEFDKMLRENVGIDEWKLEIRQCPQKHLNKLEYKVHNEMEGDENYDLLNVRSPPKSK